ncbi:MAG: Abhydrolase family protein [Paenibacillus sp.]|jgi:pimeloyl-ACP methyl ester carboxylesterase|nr:Abhydrolase family protein [Paenibacillus sp.]
MLGRNYLGMSVFQKRHILQWLKRRPIIDPARIAVSGHSLGTSPAIMLAALDPQIKAIVFNDFLCDNRIRRVVSNETIAQPSWHCVPYMLEWVTFPDIAASLAPRPIIITEGGVTADLLKVKQAYEKFGAGDRMEYHYYPMYASAERRKWDMRDFPEGLDQDQFLECANVDAPNHYFKNHLAVPWLKRVL